MPAIFATYMRKAVKIMNMIVCGNNCRYQKDGYCCLEGRAVITNAVSTPCCYYESTGSRSETSSGEDSGKAEGTV
jgi:hypothetical protein